MLMFTTLATLLCAVIGTAIAYFIRRLPLSVRSSVAILQQMSRDTEDASINLGAGLDSGDPVIAQTVAIGTSRRRAASIKRSS